MASAAMKRYRIEYRDAGDPDIQFAASWRGYDKAHAMERFEEAPDADGWEITRITEIK